MANTLNDLYLKYVNSVGQSLEDDRYFQYLFQMVQAGSNVLQQKQQVLHKVVDERWLTTIEESLDAINNIIEKPRRFVTTSEEVVPVALAKKITADSVRHLSMNTQFIASDENGEIQPTRVLNVTTEESYDLYENRFIYHLIQRLVTFIDKRTDVIFWSTGDETKNVLSYESKVDDAYEEISYKVEMTIKNRQSFAENDSDNMQVFMRIDRVRRLVMALRHSAFCGIMAGCAKVRSPIQRTNLMMKDPDYRTCYKLWQFLEGYEEVGYTIDVRDTALAFDEEYLFQLYTNFITNYAVFQSIIEHTPRDLEEALGKKRKAVRPKFIKKVQEQLVDNPDLPDVEIRRVFVEEVTQAQLDAEEKLAQETQARQTAESALAELEEQMAALQQQMMALQDMNAAAEKQAAQECAAKEAAMAQAEEERQAKEDAQQLLEQEKRACQKAQALAQQESQARTQAEEQAASQMEQTRTQAAREIEKTKNDAVQAVSQAEAAAAKAKTEAAAKIEQTKNEAAQAVARAKEAADQLVKKAQDTAQSQITQAQTRAQEAVQAMKQAQQAAQAAQAAQKAAQAAAKTAEAEAKLQRRRADKEAKAREKAQERAQANSLSKYIITALNNRKQKEDAEQQEDTETHDM